MNTYVIAFQVANAQRRSQIVAHLHAQGACGIFFESTILLRTRSTVQTLQAHLVPFLGPTDRVLILPADTTQAGGVMTGQQWNWINHPHL